jgi:YihY family inner membrane protein
MRRSEAFTWLLRHPGRFTWGVLKSFRQNQGVLLSGAVAYYTLLSILPMMSLLLVLLSALFDEQRLLAVLGEALRVLVPQEAATITHEISTFLDHRDVVGVFGFGVMIFFSSYAFTVLENAMAVIFHHRKSKADRHFLTSALLPFVFVALLGLGLLLVTVVSGLVQSGVSTELTGAASTVVYVLGMVGLVLMLTAIYLVMPVGKVSFSHALLGGVAAGVLWEIMRRVLVWYFSTLSMVNVVYGSLATAIIALLSLEVAGMIVLLGAQVIAEYERIGHEIEDEAA